MEGHLLDAKCALGSDKNQGNGEVGLLVVNVLLVSFAIDSSWVVMETDLGGIGSSVSDQVIQRFMFQCRPDGVGKHKNVLHLGLGIEKGIACSPNNAAVKSSENNSCMWEICGLFPELHCHDIIGITKEVVGHCV